MSNTKNRIDDTCAKRYRNLHSAIIVPTTAIQFQLNFIGCFTSQFYRFSTQSDFVSNDTGVAMAVSITTRDSLSQGMLIIVDDELEDDDNTTKKRKFNTKILQEGGLKVVFHQLNVIDQESIDTFCSWIKENYGGIDNLDSIIILVNSVENAEKVITINYIGTKNMIKAAIPLMKSNLAGLGRLNGRLLLLARISDDALRQQLEDADSLSEELIDATVNMFLDQVKDGSWATG
ncbi:hypothetical protein L1987_45067 [Smallanthus sonchifolius]|uniref:Uncharacterized protein n=1 Tax=Smallanthus sonchifolius TaxID=185202 RepID=A0ACB9GSA4_9ASTR|nr:hypothetical protein L1987_45067 [Smallanthus sonchifolius]